MPLLQCYPEDSANISEWPVSIHFSFQPVILHSSEASPQNRAFNLNDLCYFTRDSEHSILPLRHIGRANQNGKIVLYGSPCVPKLFFRARPQNQSIFDCCMFRLRTMRTIAATSAAKRTYASLCLVPFVPHLSQNLSSPVPS